MCHKSSRVAARLVFASALGICAAAAATRTASADIISTVGLTQITAPSFVTANFLAITSGPYQVIFPEKQGVMLAAPLITDTGTIAAGTLVDSYFFAVNSLLGDNVTTSVTFNSSVLGIIFSDGPNAQANPGSPTLNNLNFANSDFLGAPGTTYLE